MANSHQTMPLSTTQILSEALKLSTKNSTLILPILLFSSLSTLLSSYLPSTPLIADLLATFFSIASLEPTSLDYGSLLSGTINNLQRLVSSDAIFFLLSFIISSLISIATIHALSLTYSGKTSTVNDLLCKFVTRLKDPMVTSIYVALLNVAYSVLLLSTVGFFMLVAHGSTLLIALAAIVAVLGLVFYLYLTVVWSASIVVSVTVDGCYGVEAIVKAMRTVRWRWPQGASLILIVSVMTRLISAVCERGRVQLGFGNVVYVVAIVAMSLYERATSVVFYFDCRKIGGGEEMANDGGFVYMPACIFDSQDEGELP